MQNRQKLQFPLVCGESVPQTSMLKSQFNSMKACLQPATETFGVSMDSFSLHSNRNLDTVKPPSFNTSERLFPNPVSQVTFALFVAMIIFCLRAAKTNSQHIKHVTFLLFTIFRKANPLLLCPLVIVRARISYVTDLYVSASKCSSVGRCAWLTYKISLHIHASSRWPLCYSKWNLTQHNDLFLPVPIPLSTAPSLTPEALVLLVGALWGARLGRNRHLHGTRRGQINGCYLGKRPWQTQDTSTACTRICCARDLLRVCWMSAPVWLHRLGKLLEKFLPTSRKQYGNSHASKHKLHVIIWKFWAA